MKTIMQYGIIIENLKFIVIKGEKVCQIHEKIKLVAQTTSVKSN